MHAVPGRDLCMGGGAIHGVLQYFSCHPLKVVAPLLRTHFSLLLLTPSERL